jgi:hypothetical protein
MAVSKVMSTVPQQATLDPVYSGKRFSGLLDHCRRSVVPAAPGSVTGRCDHGPSLIAGLVELPASRYAGRASRSVRQSAA